MSVDERSHPIGLDQASEDHLPGLHRGCMVVDATPLQSMGQGRGPVPRRRHQDGQLKKESGYYYSFFYVDREKNGITRSVKRRFNLGSITQISPRAARREHNRLREQINRERGSVAPATKGETFADASKVWEEAIGPQLSESTLRQRKSYLRAHLLPRFGKSALTELTVANLQRFATDLLMTNSRKTVQNILGAAFSIRDYAGKCGMRIVNVSMKDLTVRKSRDEYESPYFKENEVEQIFRAAREPYLTIFKIAWYTGLRGGEILGLTAKDIDFDRRVLTPRKQADDRTRKLRELKTKGSKSPVALHPKLEEALRTYLRDHWRQSETGLLFLNRRGRPLKRSYVVKFGLKPILRKLEMKTERVGLHAFRHGLGTALCERKANPATVQKILRHSDIRTTLKYYVHSDLDAQRQALNEL